MSRRLGTIVVVFGLLLIPLVTVFIVTRPNIVVGSALDVLAPTQTGDGQTADLAQN